jgi:hypothetical protein
MQELAQEYVVLFRAVAEAEEALRAVREKLIAAEQLAEELYLERE